MQEIIHKVAVLSNKILRDMLKEEFKVTLGLSASKETMVQEIISKLFSSSPSPKDNIMQKADILIYDWTIKQKEIINNSSDTESTSSSNTKVMPVLSFNNKQVTSYKQLTREEMYTHAIQYTTKYPKREYGSKSEYCKQNKITLDQLGRLLKQFDNGKLTGKEILPRGGKSPKLTGDEIISVITDIRSQRDAKKQISDKTIHEAITTITNKTVSLSYCHSFGVKYFDQELVKTKMVKAVKLETPYERVYRLYYFYTLFAKLVFEVIEFNPANNDIFFFDETGTDTNKAGLKTYVVDSQVDNGYVASCNHIKEKDTFLVGIGSACNNSTSILDT